MLYPTELRAQPRWPGFSVFCTGGSDLQSAKFIGNLLCPDLRPEQVDSSVPLGKTGDIVATPEPVEQTLVKLKMMSQHSFQVRKHLWRAARLNAGETCSHQKRQSKLPLKPAKHFAISKTKDEEGSGMPQPTREGANIRLANYKSDGATIGHSITLKFAKVH